jgi:TP901 family phage tail tape measure protein
VPASTTGRPAAVLSILVTANTRSAQAQLAALDRQLAYSVKRSGKGGAALQRSIVGLRYTAIAGIAAIGGSVAAAAKYETAFANVRKTVAGSDKVMAGLNKRFIEMSKNSPQGAAELANLAGEAGALGVKAKDLGRFTKVASELGVTTQMTSEMAADGLARMANIMDLDVGQSVRRMADVLVDLGNKGASTEHEILEMSKRIAGSGKVAQMTQFEVMGLAAGLANLGIRAEMGGSAASRIIRTLHVASREGGKELNLLAETAGVAPAKFADAVENDMVGALGMFLDGLAQVEKDGGSAQLVLRDLGTTLGTNFGEIRISDTLMRAMSSGKGSASELARAMKIATEEGREGGAMLREYTEYTDTLSAQASILGNKIEAMGIEFGNLVMPDIREIVDILGDDSKSIEQKVQDIMDQLGDIIDKASGPIWDIASGLGKGIATGIWSGFWNGSPLTKLFIGASLIRMFGGPGVLGAAGSRVAAPIMASFMQRMQYMIGLGHLYDVQQAQRAAMVQKYGAYAGGRAFDKTAMKPAGTTLGRGLAFSTANAIPMAFAAAGVVNIVQDVMDDDLEGAMIETGGMAAGAIIGGLVGGLPGVFMGAGIGSLLGSLVDPLFRNDTETLAERLARIAEENHKRYEDAMGSYVRADKMVRRSQRGVKQANKDVKQAQDALAKARDDYPENSRQVLEADQKLTREVHRQIRARKKLEALEKVTGAAREVAKYAAKTDISTAAGDLVDLQTTARGAREEFLRLKELYGRRDPRVLESLNEWGAAQKAVLDKRNSINEILAETETKIGEQFADKLRNGVQSLGQQVNTAELKIALLYDRLLNVLPGGVAENVLSPKGFNPDDWMQNFGDMEMADQATKAERQFLRLGERLMRLNQIAEGFTLGGLNDLNEGNKKLSDSTKDVGDKLENTSRRGKTSLAELATRGIASLLNLDTKSNEHATQLKDGVVQSVWEMVWKTAAGYQAMEDDTSSSLESLGIGAISFGISAVANALSGGDDKKKTPPKKQKGGFVEVPGTGTGDKVDLHARVEPGELVGVINKNAAGRIKAINQQTPRWGKGFQRGGTMGSQVIEAIGPVNMPPFVYAADHDGGNRHLHLAMSSSDAIVAFGQKLQAAGYSVSGHPAFGAVGSHTAGSYHYSNQAIDINTAADETTAEIARVVAMLGGAAGAVVEKIKRQVLTGPKGSLLDMGQAGLDKVWNAANKFIQSKAPAMGMGNIEGVEGGAYDKGSLMALWQRAGGTPSAANLAAAVAMAESGGDPNAENHNSNGTIDRGLWQINSIHGAHSTFDPMGNARGAVSISSGGSNWTPWVAYNAGAHAQFLQKGGVVNPMWGGWHAKGGSFSVDRPTLFGAGEAGREDVFIRPHRDGGHAPKVELHVHGAGAAAALATIDDVYAIVDGERHEVDRHGKQIRRMRNR